MFKILCFLQERITDAPLLQAEKPRCSIKLFKFKTLALDE